MSEFDDEMRDGMAEAIEFLGATGFEIDGQSYQGDLSELGDEAFAVVVGGKDVIVRASLVCPIGQFDGAAIPASGRLRIGERLFMIATKTTDTISVTFNLADANASR